MNTWLTLAIVPALLLSCFVNTDAQIDDLADSEWAVPQWDALEQFREDPLCLPCIDAHELTILPGISQRTASRIMKLVKGGVLSVDAMADSLCLSLDQRIILASCTSFDCSCAPSITSGRLRSRLNSTSGVTPDVFTRGSVNTSFGVSVGGFARQLSDTLLHGEWLQANFQNARLVAGLFTHHSSLGLLFGGSAFGRSAIQRVTSSTDPQLKPWNSLWTDGALRGLGVSYANTAFVLPLNATLFYSRKSVDGRNESLIGATCQVPTSMFQVPCSMFQVPSVTVNILAINYDAISSSESMRVLQHTSNVLASVSVNGVIPIQLLRNGIEYNSEFAFDLRGNVAIAACANVQLQRNRFSLLVRSLTSDFRSPYGSSMSSLTSLGNEEGLAIGVQLSLEHGWKIESVLDVHRTLSRAYGKPLPTKGFDFLVDAVKSLGKGASTSCRLRFESEEDGYRADGTSFSQIQEMQRVTCRTDCTLQPLKNLRVRMRVDGRIAAFNIGRTTETGLLAFIDVMWQPLSSISIRGRTTTYRSGSIDVAPYAVEYETQGSMRTLIGNGIGDQAMLSIEYSPFSIATFGFAYVESVKDNALSRRAVAQFDVAF